MALIKTWLQLLPILLVKYYCVPLASSSEIILDKVNNNEDYLKSECVKKLITNQRCGTHITIVVPDANFKDFIKINSSCYSYLVVTYGPVKSPIKPHVYLVYYKIVNTNPTVWQMRYNENWNPKAKFIFVTTPEVQYPELKEIFQKLYKYYIYDVTVLTQINKTQGMWAFYPPQDGNCLPNHDKLEYLGPCASNAIFPVGEDLRNCTVSVTGNRVRNTKSYINYIQHLEEYLINVTAETIGFKLNYTFEDYDTNEGEVLTNNTSVGMLNILQKRKADIVFGSFFLTARRASAYDFISGYKYTRINLIIPNQGKKRWRIFYKTFKTEVWCLIACSFISMTVVTMAMSYYCFNIKRISRLPFHLIDYLFGHSDTNLFKVKRLRIILISWIFFTFFVTSFYNSEIFYLLTTKQYTQKSLSIDELKKNGYTACISDTFRLYTTKMYNVSLPEQIPECKRTETILDTITSRENYYTIADYSQYHNNICHYNEKRFDKLDIFNNIIYVLYTNKGFFLTEKFNKIFRTMFESGIITDNHLNSFLNKNCAEPPHQSKQIYKVLSLENLKLSFYLLLSGYLISFVVLLLEFIYKKYSS